MSYILDALKKVEHEKLKKSGPGGITSIAGDLFNEKMHPPARGGRWRFVIVTAAVVSLVTFAAAWFIFGGNNKLKRTPHLVSGVPSPPVPGLVSPAAPVAVQGPVSPVPGPAASFTASAVMPASSLPEDEEGRPIRSAKIRTKMSSPVVAPMLLNPSLPKIQAPPDLKLSGIAWQDERAARRAVVNGFLLREGGVVSGAKITDILPDKVRFSLSGGSFELRLDTAPVAETKR